MTGDGRVPEIPPVTHWSFACDDALVAAKHAWEADVTLALDRSGGLYRLDRDGRPEAMTRLKAKPTGLAVSHDGAAVVVFADRVATLLDATLRVTGRLEMEDDVLAADFAPFGRAVAFSLASRLLRLFDLSGPKPRRVVEFDTPRPKEFLAFLTTTPRLAAVSEHDVLALYDARGRLQWEDRVRSNCGGLAVSGDGALIALAAYTHGAVLYDGTGRRRGVLLVEGSPARVAVDHNGSTIAVATVERTVARLTPRGTVRWTEETEEDVVALAVDGLGRSLVIGTADGRLARVAWTDLGGREDESPEGLDY